MKGSKNIIVGVFVAMGLLMAGMVVFLVGNDRRLFSASKPYRTSFADVQGLKPGAPVRMGGIDVGNVKAVGYSKDKDKTTDMTVFVEFVVVDAERGRLKPDTKAKIATKGLLGDKMIELSVGEQDGTVEPGSYIPPDLSKDLFSRASDMAGKAEGVMDNVGRVTESLANEELHQNLRETVANLNAITNELVKGEGYPRRLLASKEEADRISSLIQNLERTSIELSGTLRSARSIVSRVEQGPGFAHDLIYGQGPPQLAQFGRAADEVANTLEGVRKGDGLAHDMLYGGKGDGAEAMKNVTAMTADLRAMIADMRAGKGTIGGLLVDPSIYEDVKVVLGNVQRNDVLRALVRYSIHHDESKPKVEVNKP